MSKKNNFKAIDFFCGAGGMTYGFEAAGIKVIAGIDNDPACEQTYRINNPNSKFICSDLAKLKESALTSETKIKPNDDRLIFIGCSPCQYWTRLKTNKIKSSKSKNLLIEFARFIKYFLPGYVVIENVPGLIKNTKESPLKKFLKLLEELRYHYDYSVLNTNHYGVPQNRMRFVLIASRVNQKICLPLPSKNYLPVVRNFIGIENGFAPIEPGQTDNTDFKHSVSNLSAENIERLKLTPKDGGNRLSWKNNPKLQINAYKNKDNVFRDTYGRMYWDKPAPTITTKFYSISNGRFAHPSENRAISLREGATLQTFPKNYRFATNSLIACARLIGNAVPPEFARRIGEKISKFED